MRNWGCARSKLQLLLLLPFASRGQDKAIAANRPSAKNAGRKCADQTASEPHTSRQVVGSQAGTSSKAAHNLNRLISLATSAFVCALPLALLLLQLLMPAECARLRKPRQPTAAALFDDDLIEGRLETGQLCGTRYPAGPFSRLKLDANSNSTRRLAKHDGALPTDLSGGERAQRAHNQNNLLYIVGGDEVDEGQFWPWSVAIYELDPLNGQRAFICSGSLISERFVLTAAHCIQQSRFDILTAEEISLKIASTRLDDERAHFYQVERIFVHPDYTVDRKTNDIALLRLRANQRLPARARPICLPSQVANRVDFTDQQVTIIGWGKTSAMQGNEPARLIDLKTAGTSHQQSSLADERPLDAVSQELEATRQTAADSQTNDTLLQAEVRVTSTDQCNRNYSRLEISWLNIDEHFLCASDPQGKRDACQGDSGGPLMWNKQQGLFSGGGGGNSDQEAAELEGGAQEKWYQLGLVSFGYGCANQQYPGVYTRISYYMPWILRTVKTAATAAWGRE